MNALHHAAKHPYQFDIKGSVQKLLAVGVDANHRNREGKDPLTLIFSNTFGYQEEYPDIIQDFIDAVQTSNIPALTARTLLTS